MQKLRELIERMTEYKKESRVGLLSQLEKYKSEIEKEKPEENSLIAKLKEIKDFDRS